MGPENADLYRVFIGSYIALLMDSPCDSKPTKVLRQFFHRLVRTDATSLIKEFKQLGDTLLRSIKRNADGTITCPFIPGFKRTPVFKEFLRFQRTGCSETLRFVLTFCFFGKKLDYLDESFHSTALRQWMDIESEMDAFDIPRATLRSIKLIVSQLLGPLDDTYLVPKHGPGYTAEGLISPNEKLDSLSMDLKCLYTFRDHAFGKHSRESVTLSGSGVGDWRNVHLAAPVKEQVGRLKFVPKDVTKSRSICMEPISRMYFQQEVMRWLVQSFAPWTNKIIRLRDQTWNQRFALAGSENSSCDTVDLSAASDRVHVDLVRAVFPKKTLFYLLGTRTDKVSTPDGTVALNKFAPMGSALCFPVQSILFTAITVLGYVMQHNGAQPGEVPSEDWDELHDIRSFLRTMHEVPEQSRQRLLLPRVYGDDIICDKRATDYVLRLLEQCGLKVNHDKTFMGESSPIRESCGIFAYDGEDITPMLFRVRTFRRVLDVKSYTSWIDSINRAGDFGYRHLRSFLINVLKRTPVQFTKWKQARSGKLKPITVVETAIDTLPFTNDRSQFGIFSTREKVVFYSLNSRRNWTLQLQEHLVLGVSSYGRDKKSLAMEAYAYNQNRRALLRGVSDGEQMPSPRYRPSAARLELGWTPAR